MSKPAFQGVFAASGRGNRKSYVLYLLAIMLIGAALFVPVMIAGSGGDDGGGALVLALLFLLPIAVSAWLVAAQRCRDFGWTGWAVLLSLVPLVGWVFSLAILSIPGDVGPNRYGPDPLAPMDSRPPAPAPREPVAA